jgi:two-component sensor histidine kinase/putative methionine-R-sulfoxide reductase with GAF domain
MTVRTTQAKQETPDDMSKLRGLLRRRAHELNTIRGIFHAITATSDLRSVLDTIVRTTASATGADSVSIYLLDTSSQTLILKSTTGLYPLSVDHAQLKMGQGLTGWSAQHRQKVTVRDAWNDERFHAVPNTREKPFKSLMAVPLVSQDRVIGAMNIQTHRLHTWTEAETEFASLISEVVAGALERAILFEQTEHKMRELSAVAEVSRAVIAPAYLDDTLRVVAEMAAHAVNSRRCSLLLLDENDNAYVPRAVYDEQTGIPSEPSWPVNNLPLLNIDSLAQPIIVSNVLTEMQPENAQWAEQNGLAALLSVPMTVHDRTIGLMNVWSQNQVDFSAAQVELCTTLANQIALAIENAHLIGTTAIVREMNHRVKNNLQNIVMLLQLQMSDDRKVTAKEVLHESINRIMSIAAVHDALAQEGFRLVDVKDVITRVVNLVHANMTRPDQTLEVTVTGDSIRLSSRAATAVALCANELVQNAMEHAFVDRTEGKISVNLASSDGNVVLEVRDNGRGSVAKPAEPLTPSHSLGLNIVETLVKDDLRGTFQLKHSTKGSTARIEAPMNLA